MGYPSVTQLVSAARREASEFARLAWLGSVTPVFVTPLILLVKNQKGDPTSAGRSEHQPDERLSESAQRRSFRFGEPAASLA